MARIRTIKPEYWTDEKIVQLPFEARLLFIGLWNFCDDQGFIEDEPMRIKLQIFPADTIDVEFFLDVLVSAELLVRGSFGDVHVIQIPHFLKHQKVSHPASPRWDDCFHKKASIPRAVRRAVALKYDCPVGKSREVQCYTCGSPGMIYWTQSWVGTSGLEFSHLIPESSGGQTNAENIVFCCKFCNRSMHTRNAVAHIELRIPEDSGALRPERNGTERKGIEGKGIEIKNTAARASNNRARADDEPEPRAGAFTSLSEADLRDTSRLVDWWSSQAKHRKPVIGSSEADRIRVVAAAELALAKGKNPVALFASTIAGKHWERITQRHEDAATVRLREFDRDGRPPPARVGKRHGGAAAPTDGPRSIGAIIGLET